MLSIILPSYNEEKMIPIAAQRLGAILIPENIDYELVFVDDGSKDSTWQQIQDVAKSDSHVVGVHFSRNFGKEAAMFAGLEEAKGDCCVVIDCDLQHPPEKIVDMYRLWEEGYEIVEGIKNSRGEESGLHKIFAGTFYKVISALVGFDMQNSSDFKLLDRKVINVLLDMPERKTFFRAMSFWVGYKSTQVVYDVAPRAIGTTKWSFVSLLRYAISNIVSFSTRPLNLVNYMGIIALLVGGILAIQTLIRWARGDALEGFTTVILLLLLIGGGILLGLGLIGNYIAAIYYEVKGRPRYLVRLDTETVQEQNRDV